MNTLDQLRAISDEAAAADGTPPVDEGTWRRLRIRHDFDGVTLVDGGFSLVTDGRADVVVAPSRRGEGIGRTLAEGLDAPVREAWSHADHPAAAHLAEELGWRRERALWVMRRTKSL